MQDGVVRLEVNEGVIRSIRVGSGLGLVYRDLYTSARENLSSTEPQMQAAVKLVVFGCFLLEARVNEVLKAVMLEALQQPRAAESIWRAIERQRFEQKLDVLIAMSPGLDPELVNGLGAKTSPLFALRNRLAHFKPDTSEVEIPLPDGVPDAEELARIFLDSPDSDLIQLLKSDEMYELAANVEEIEGVLEEIYEEHFHVEKHFPGELDGKSYDA